MSLHILGARSSIFLRKSDLLLGMQYVWRILQALRVTRLTLSP